MVTYIGRSPALVSGSSTQTITLPTGTTAGDLLLFVGSSTSAGSWSAPGFSSVGTTTNPMMWKIATASDVTTGSITFSIPTAACSLILATYRGAATTSPTTVIASAGFSSGTITTLNPPATPTVSSPDLLAIFAACTVAHGAEVSAVDSNLARRYYVSNAFTANPFNGLWDGPGTVNRALQIVNPSFSGTMNLTSIRIANGNTAPNAPALTSPANLALIDRTITQRFAWQFSDPDAGDSQSKFDLQWWPCDASWARTGAATTISQTIPNQFNDFAANYWAAGNFEWQVRTYDSHGVVGPWSSSSFFTAATAPTPPTITAPTSGGTVSNTQTVTWSEPNQDSYQIRRVADNAGSADTGTVYYDSGEVVDSTSRSATLTFETNNRWEHIQLRIKYSGLWSSWTDIRVDVSYTSPAGIVGSLSPDVGSGSLLVNIANQAPAGGQPANSYNEVWVDDGLGLGSERVATSLPLDTAYRYELPVSGRDYAGNLFVRTYGTNGTHTDTLLN